MINIYNDDIRLTDPSRRKFNSAMAEWLHSLEPDAHTGSVEWCESVQLFGKRILFEDSLGFVTCEKYPTAAEALRRFELIDDEYGQWLDLDDGVEL